VEWKEGRGVTIESSDPSEERDCSESTTWLQTMVWIGEWDHDPDYSRNYFWPRADDCTGESDGSLSADSCHSIDTSFCSGER
jgi:hypothetical protein